MREEAVCVKNDKWSDDQQWSRFEKDFRIHDYEAYSVPGAWGGKLGFGDFGRLTQPSGIRLKAGEFAYLYVDNDVANADAKLYVEMPVGTNNTGPQQALKKGFNKVMANGDCELFITYQNTNTETPLSDHPNIKTIDCFSSTIALDFTTVNECLLLCHQNISFFLRNCSS